MDSANQSASFSEVKASAARFVKSEIKLAITELKHATGHVKSGVKGVAIGAVMALLGVLPLMAFLVIGLGDLLDGRYALSSFIVFAAFTGIGGIVAYLSLKRMKVNDLSLPRTRLSLVQTGDEMTRTARDVRNHASAEIRETAKSTFRRPA